MSHSAAWSQGGFYNCVRTRMMNARGYNRTDAELQWFKIGYLVNGPDESVRCLPTRGETRAE